MRHLPPSPYGDLVDHVELCPPHFLIRVEDPVRGANEWLFEVDGVIDHGHDHQVVAMPDESFRHRRPVAVRYAVALKPAGLEMRGRDLERVAVPPGGRETGPRVGGVRGRM